MKRISTKKVEQFKHNEVQYKRTQIGTEVEWEFYNDGWGEHGWVPLFRNGGEITVEEAEKMYQNEFA